MLNPKLIGLAIGLMGVVLLIAGAYVTSQQMALLDRCLETTAVVTDLHWEEEWVETEEGGFFTWVGWPVFFLWI